MKCQYIDVDIVFLLERSGTTELPLFIQASFLGNEEVPKIEV